MNTMITLGDMAAKGMTMLVVARRRYNRLSIARLIADGFGDLRQILLTIA